MSKVDCFESFHALVQGGRTQVDLEGILSYGDKAESPEGLRWLELELRD